MQVQGTQVQGTQVQGTQVQGNYWDSTLEYYFLSLTIIMLTKNFDKIIYLKIKKTLKISWLIK